MSSQTSRVSTATGGPKAIWSAVEAEDEIPAARLLQVVGGDHQAAALGGKLGEQLGQQLLARLVDPAVRLVEEHDRPVLDKRPCDEHPLALAARELAELRVGEVGEADTVERIQSRAAARGGRPGATRGHG